MLSVSFFAKPKQEDQSDSLTIGYDRSITAALPAARTRDPFLQQEATEAGIDQPAFDFIGGVLQRLVGEVLLAGPTGEFRILPQADGHVPIAQWYTTQGKFARPAMAPNRRLPGSGGCQIPGSR